MLRLSRFHHDAAHCCQLQGHGGPSGAERPCPMRRCHKRWMTWGRTISPDVRLFALMWQAREFHHHPVQAICPCTVRRATSENPRRSAPLSAPHSASSAQGALPLWQHAYPAVRDGSCGSWPRARTTSWCRMPLRLYAGMRCDPHGTSGSIWAARCPPHPSPAQGSLPQSSPPPAAPPISHNCCASGALSTPPELHTGCYANARHCARGAHMPCLLTLSKAAVLDLLHHGMADSNRGALGTMLLHRLPAHLITSKGRPSSRHPSGLCKKGCKVAPQQHAHLHQHRYGLAELAGIVCSIPSCTSDLCQTACRVPLTRTERHVRCAPSAGDA